MHPACPWAGWPVAGRPAIVRRSSTRACFATATVFPPPFGAHSQCACITRQPAPGTPPSPLYYSMTKPRIALISAAVTAVVVALVVYEVVATGPVRGAIRSCAELFTLANRPGLTDSERIEAARALCSALSRNPPAQDRPRGRTRRHSAISTRISKHGARVPMSGSAPPIASARSTSSSTNGDAGDSTDQPGFCVRGEKSCRRWSSNEALLVILRPEARFELFFDVGCALARSRVPLPAQRTAASRSPSPTSDSQRMGAQRPGPYGILRRYALLSDAAMASWLPSGLQARP